MRPYQEHKGKWKIVADIYHQGRKGRSERNTLTIWTLNQSPWSEIEDDVLWNCYCKFCKKWA